MRTSWPTRRPSATICANEISGSSSRCTMRPVVSAGQDVAGVPVGRRDRAFARRNRIAVRIDVWVAQRRRQPIGVGGRERVFAPLGGRVDVAQRQPRFVGEVALEQPMGADDLQREPLAFRRQLELLALASRAGPALCMRPTSATTAASRQLQGAGQRRERAAAAAVLLLEQVLQRVLELLAVACRPLPARRHQQQAARRPRVRRAAGCQESWHFEFRSIIILTTQNYRPDRARVVSILCAHEHRSRRRGT